MIKIYFAGSISGGRNDLELYKQIIRYLQLSCEVLTEHIGDDNITSSGETGWTDREIYDRDLAWLSDADMVVAEVSTPSLGVGYEIAKAIELKKKVLCLYRGQEGRRLSAMISGCRDVIVKEYQSSDDIWKILDLFLSEQV